MDERGGALIMGIALAWLLVAVYVEWRRSGGTW